MNKQFVTKATSFAKKTAKNAVTYAKKAYSISARFSKKAFVFGKALAKKTFTFTKKASVHIFYNIIRPGFFGTVKFLKHSPRVLATCIAVVLLISCTATVALATGATTAYAVICDGKTIASVKDASVLAEAEILAVQKLNNTACNDYLADASLSQTIVSSVSLTDSTTLAQLIIDNSKDIVTATVLKANGKEVAKGEKIDSCLECYLNDYKITNNLEEVEFCCDMQVADIYTTNSQLDALPMVNDYLTSGDSTLAVQTVSTVTVTEPVNYETIKVESNKYTVGSQIVTQKGVKGSAEVTYKIATVDGKVTKKVKISSKVITKPTPKKVTVGTKRIIAADKNGSAPMMWPVKRVERSYVSSYVGDGRGHKGMDIVAPKGTPIYAAEAGTVVSSGWSNSGYGYKIVIKHENGLETLYAHCSALYVKAGDTVARGETIAAVGTTGRSTGNHLHFEVHKNGAFVNPANYIGSN